MFYYEFLITEVKMLLILGLDKLNVREKLTSKPYNYFNLRLSFKDVTESFVAN